MPEAIARGLKIDVGHGSHFSYGTARIVLDAGVIPDTLGADMHGYNTSVPPPPGTPDFHPDEEDHMFKGKTRFGLVSAMTSMLALGLPLDHVVAMVTRNAGRMIGMEGEQQGVTGKVRDKEIALGNANFLKESGIDTSPLANEAETLRRDGATAIFIAIDRKPAGILAIADPVKPSTVPALKALRDDGIRIVMLTGDNRTTAEAIARRLGISEIEAEVLPDQKAKVVEKLRREGGKVAMAGDGVNDAPGTDVAMESAGATLLKGDLMGIVRARRLSEATMGNIRQNLFFAFVYNALGVPVAAGALYPLFGILLSPIIGAAAMALSSVSVIGNALRLRWAKL